MKEQERDHTILEWQFVNQAPHVTIAHK